MAHEVTVLDGGMGRGLLRIGAPFRQPEWSALALVEGPDWIVQAHTNFIEAGSDVITTNSYALVPFHIGEEAFARDAMALAALSGALARRAADGSGRYVRIAGSLPPLFGSYRPDLFDAADAARIIDPLVSGLAEHVDIWLAETLSSIAEATAVADALERAEQSKPLWIAYTLAESAEPLLRSGERVADAVRAAVDLGATAVLFNCCQSESIGPAVAIARAEVGDRAEVGGYANRFVSSHDSIGGANEQLSGFRDDLSPEVYAEVVSQWTNAGATIVGGCCGMTPDHIAALAASVHPD